MVTFHHVENLQLSYVCHQNWIFCVDDKLFTSALHEYYRDKFSANLSPVHNNPSKIKSESDEGGSTSEGIGKEVNSINFTEKNLGNVLAVSPPTPPRPPTGHDDSWTLQYLSQHGEYVALYIDLDRSGYIRISEANAFTSTIPDGWTLPQWCAYKAAGNMWPLPSSYIASS